MKPSLLKTPAQAAVLITPTISEDLGPDVGVICQSSPAIEAIALLISGDPGFVLNQVVNLLDTAN